MNCFYKLGLAASYNQVMELIGMLAGAVCKQFEQQGLVCPSSLRKFLLQLEHWTISTTTHLPQLLTVHFMVLQ